MNPDLMLQQALGQVREVWIATVVMYCAFGAASFIVASAWAWCGVHLAKAVGRWIDAKTREQEIATELGNQRPGKRPGNGGGDDSSYMPRK